MNCKTILLVEDDEEIRHAICEALELYGYTVRTANNGQDALEQLAESEKPSLILLDMMMPVMDGRAFLSRVKDDASTASIPIVVTTAGNDGNIEGATSLIKKPFRLDHLLEAVKKHCG